MAYEYDVFFSYKRDPQSDEWHRVVKDRLAFFLRLELAQSNLSIFFDTEEITTGLYWKDKLSDAAKRSKCLIGIWSPLYFRSKWCVSEWKTFTERERLWNCNAVVAASYHDGKHFPADAQAKQLMDFSDFTSNMTAFWTTASAVDFEKKLKLFARHAAKIIQSVPAYDDSFPISEAVDQDLAAPADIGRPASA